MADVFKKSNFSLKLQESVSNMQCQIRNFLFLIEENKNQALIDETNNLEKFQSKIQIIEAEILKLKYEFFSTDVTANLIDLDKSTNDHDTKENLID